MPFIPTDTVGKEGYCVFGSDIDYSSIITSSMYQGLCVYLGHYRLHDLKVKNVFLPRVGSECMVVDLLLNKHKAAANALVTVEGLKYHKFGGYTAKITIKSFKSTGN